MSSEPGTSGPMMLTYKQACAQAGISMTRLYQLMREGEITPLKPGPRIRRIDPEDLKAYVDRLKAERDAAERDAKDSAA